MQTHEVPPIRPTSWERPKSFNELIQQVARHGDLHAVCMANTGKGNAVLQFGVQGGRDYEHSRDYGQGTQQEAPRETH